MMARALAKTVVTAMAMLFASRASAESINFEQYAIGTPASAITAGNVKFIDSGNQWTVQDVSSYKIANLNGRALVTTAPRPTLRMASINGDDVFGGIVMDLGWAAPSSRIEVSFEFFNGVISDSFRATVECSQGHADGKHPRPSGFLPPCTGIIPFFTHIAYAPGFETPRKVHQVTIPSALAEPRDYQIIILDNVSLTDSLQTASLSISPTTLPAATLLKPYTASVVASGGSGPYQYTISGAPSWLTMPDNNQGRLSGTPAQQGSFTFSITVRDLGIGATTKSFPFTMFVGSNAIIVQGPTTRSIGTPIPPPQIRVTAGRKN